jgi:hypothetical protein
LAFLASSQARRFCFRINDVEEASKRVRYSSVEHRQESNGRQQSKQRKIVENAHPSFLVNKPSLNIQEAALTAASWNIGVKSCNHSSMQESTNQSIHNESHIQSNTEMVKEIEKPSYIGSDLFMMCSEQILVDDVNHSAFPINNISEP